MRARRRRTRASSSSSCAGRRERSRPRSRGTRAPPPRPGTPRRQALRRELEDPRCRPGRARTRRRASAVLRRLERQLQHEGRAEDVGARRARCPPGRGPRRTRAAPSRRASAAAACPATASRTSSFVALPFIDAEQTYPPGIASTSTPTLPERRRSSGSSSGTTGGASRPCRRRGPGPAARGATTPAALSARSGVSKKYTCRICASIGSSPSAAIAGRSAALGERHLQLDGVGAVHQPDELPELLARTGRAASFVPWSPRRSPLGRTIRRV